MYKIYKRTIDETKKLKQLDKQRDILYSLVKRLNVFKTSAIPHSIYRFNAIGMISQHVIL